MALFGNTTVFTSGDGALTVREIGAQPLRFDPEGTEPVLYVSSASDWGERDDARGGVPICFPWFGVGAAGEAPPKHGFVRHVPWRLVAQEESSLTLEVTADEIAGMEDVDGYSDAYASAFAARFTVRHEGTTLFMELTVRNTGSADFTYEAALHSYFNVGDARTVTIDGLEGRPYTDNTRDNAPGTEVGSFHIPGTIDRIYDVEGPITLTDPTLGRTITVDGFGAGNAVVWNPGPRPGVADIGQGEEEHFVCVETAEVRGHATTIAPGAEHTLSTRIDVASAS